METTIQCLSLNTSLSTTVDVTQITFTKYIIRIRILTKLLRGIQMKFHQHSLIAASKAMHIIGAIWKTSPPCQLTFLKLI